MKGRRGATGHVLPYKTAPPAHQSSGFRQINPTVYYNQRLFLINTAEVLLPVSTR